VIGRYFCCWPGAANRHTSASKRIADSAEAGLDTSCTQTPDFRNLGEADVASAPHVTPTTTINVSANGMDRLLHPTVG